MPIRTKTVCHSTWISSSYSGYYTTICDTLPINDWQIYLQNPQFAWNQGNANPSNFSQVITVPELQFVYPNVTTFRFTIELTNSYPSVEWLGKTCNGVVGNFVESQELDLNINPGESTTIDYIFKNLNNLPSGTYNLVIKLRAYGDGVALDTENSMPETTGTISFTVQNTVTPNSINTDKNICNLTFNKAGSILSGDTTVLAYNSGISAQLNFTSLSASVTPSGSNSLVTIAKNSSTNNLAVGVYNGNILTLTSGTVTKDIILNLEVINDATQFSPEVSIVNFTLIKADNLQANGNVNISNPNNLTISVDSFPNFIENISLQNNVLTFVSKHAQVLGTGMFSGNVVLKAGNVTKNISVVIQVVEQISHDFTGSPYFFALDKKKVELTKVSSNAVKVLMKLDMFFIGYGQTHQEIQTYQLSYFQNKAVFYPGDEVNDFFVKQRKLQDFSQTFDAYNLAIVKMTFSELDVSDAVLNSYLIDNIKFAPGYKPYCFPFFTDFKTRRVFGNSKLCISADLIGQKPELTNLLTAINQNQGSGSKVSTFVFQNPNPDEITDFQKVELIPIPTIQKTVNLFWETHNLVFDWFTCTGNYTIPSDFEHTVAENVGTGKEEKYDTKQTDTFTINTGWILKEEREIIDAIISSNYCIIELPEKTIKAQPTGKKNTLKTSEEGFEEFILEFKVLRDER